MAKKGFSLGGLELWIGIAIGYFGHGIISWLIGLVTGTISSIVGHIV